MKNTKFTLEDWMKESRIPSCVEARKYVIGQNLSDEDAREIRFLLTGSIAHAIGVIGGKSQERVCCESAVKYFLGMFMFLMGDFRVPAESNWSYALENTLDSDEIMICNMLANELSSWK